MLTLTFITGIVDAVGYLLLDRVFTGNMTGNVVILGMAIAGRNDLPVTGPLLALGTFAVAAFGAGFALRRCSAGWTGAVTILLALGASVLVVVATFLSIGANSSVVHLVAAALTAAVMGTQATVARKVAIPDLTTVVVTSTLTSWASETLIKGGPRAVLNRRLGAMVSICAGALTGAWLLHLEAWVPMALAAGLTAFVSVVGHLALRVRSD